MWMTSKISEKVLEKMQKSKTLKSSEKTVCGCVMKDRI